MMFMCSGEPGNYTFAIIYCKMWLANMVLRMDSLIVPILSMNIEVYVAIFLVKICIVDRPSILPNWCIQVHIVIIGNYCGSSGG